MSDQKPHVVHKRRSTAVDSLFDELDAPPLARARVVARALQTATDDLNASLRQAEIELAKLGLGVSASTTLVPPAEDGWFHSLKFGKDGNEWKFILVSGDAGDDPEHWNESPLLNASREWRERAAHSLPELLDALIARAERKAEQVQESSDEVAAFLKDLSGGAA